MSTSLARLLDFLARVSSWGDGLDDFFADFPMDGGAGMFGDFEEFMEMLEKVNSRWPDNLLS